MESQREKAEKKIKRKEKEKEKENFWLLYLVQNGVFRLRAPQDPRTAPRSAFVDPFNPLTRATWSNLDHLISILQFDQI